VLAWILSSAYHRPMVHSARRAAVGWSWLRVARSHAGGAGW
jgi:hypothetical protein